MTTPGQTIGPFFGFALPFDGDSELVPPGSPGSVQLTGVVLDGGGQPVPDALLEIWQTDSSGTITALPGSLRRDGHTFTGWGRAATDLSGRYSFTTLRPTGFVAVTVFARGLAHRLLTRAYVPEAPDDALLRSLPQERRTTLRMTQEKGRLVLDLRLQGDGETVFLRFPGEQP